ncbi:MAG: phosphate/phosphite/phosphonate ABC transporter substrate-binding protein [Bifidobacteriaceae bacterium]|jgi:hypothetical protein|nr:phosphate/phosphite/phosphonate ABC transporter substrate-binding protein [Bifidobacteriaceae bacterium]MCI1914859.1 phosphate/phosphite/phosphonate ABC transporter substrate-binding protein [Bifidobacteriaceae bacterium]
MPTEVSELAKQRSQKFLDYLSAVGREIGAEPVRNVNDVEQLILENDIHVNQFIKLGPSGSRESWLLVKKPPLLLPVVIPEELKRYIKVSTLDDPDTEPQLRLLIKRSADESKKENADSSSIETPGEPEEPEDDGSSPGLLMKKSVSRKSLQLFRTGNQRHGPYGKKTTRTFLNADEFIPCCTRCTFVSIVLRKR